ncbi:alpha/beta fold hydrolase [bacterium]|jgi:pimeloyl-ACP methyl ester carboxylesterase|nr:alpha/beta fold hydrolase [bacterium]
MKINNPSGENIDFVIEGDQNSSKTLILVHGFGTGKDESQNLFPDFVKSLKGSLRIIRFDFTGYGLSEGRDVDVDYIKQTKDLNTIINYVNNNFSGQIYIYAHSMGCFITAMLNPEGIAKTILGAPPSTAADIGPAIQDRIIKQGGRVDEKGITIYPRSSGDITKIGPSFWQVIKNLDEHQAVVRLAENTKLLILKPMQDDVAGNDNYEHYKQIKNLTYQEINGGHNFSKPEDREVLIQKVKKFLLDS